MEQTLLEVEDLKTWLDSSAGTVRAIDGISLEVARGETFAIVGESGCGKSMTALSVLRLLPEAGQIVGGSVRLSGEDLLTLPESAMRNVRGRRIAMIFQEPGTSLNPVLTVERQIAEVLERHTMLRGDAARRRMLELIAAVGIPDAERRLGEFSFQLSGGLKQRVMIAMALAAEPDLLIADEPTTALDVTIQAQVLEVLRELQKTNGMAILLITHDLGVVAQMAHKVAVMYAGQIVEIATREQFFSAPRHPYSRKLFLALPGGAKRGGDLAVIKGQVPPLTIEFRGCRFAERCDSAWERCFAEVPGWTPVDDGHRVRCHLYDEKRAPAHASQAEGAVRADPAVQAGAALLQVRELKVHFPIRKGLLKRTVGQVKAVDGVSFAIAACRTLALVGESGCGKTTAGKAILQLIRPSAGAVQFDGQELTRLRGRALRERRADFQMIFQDPYSSLNPRMRVADILAEGMRALGVADTSAERAARMDRMLAQVGLNAEVKLRYPHEFSGGQRQRIAIARALAVNPKLIVCDEPTSALDVSVQAQILNLLKQLQRDLGLAYLFITHNIAVVEYLAHEVAVMYLGRVVERGTVDEVLRRPKHPYTQALLSAVPTLDQAGERRIIRLQGELPSPANPPPGCHFHPRCPQAMAECKLKYPEAVRVGDSHEVSCLLYAAT
ncbi:MAG: ABC transporter ATP-binding protein [Betaproteobacteria bacterium RIFCSPLOWO2_12_FULL_62_13b]|nr:MAG: ABC transporter ATP-binding protein [Betaproteobacteria bacterium RIFCSPLOWO2_12_FULL_62_13b]